MTAPSPRPRVGLRKATGARILPMAIAVVALGFVAWIIPIRDHCYDPASPTTTQTTVTRSAGECVLHLKSGDVTVGLSACARLKCEPGLLSTLGHARIGVLLALLGLYGVGTIAWAARWRALLGFAGVALPVTAVWRISVEAQAGGILLPGGVGGDVLRIGGVLGQVRRERGEARPTLVVASVLLDRLVGLSTISAVAATFGIAFGNPAPGAEALIAVLVAIPVTFVLGLVFLNRIPWLRFGLGEGRLGRALGPVLSYLRDPRAPRALALAGVLSVIVALTQFGVIRGLVFALGASPSDEKWVYVGAAMAFIVAALPALPGGWGTADAAYVFFFGLGGIHASEALAVCLLFRLFWYLLGALGAVLHLTRRRGADGEDRQRG